MIVSLIEFDMALVRAPGGQKVSIVSQRRRILKKSFGAVITTAGIGAEPAHVATPDAMVIPGEMKERFMRGVYDSNLPYHPEAERRR